MPAFFLSHGGGPWPWMDDLRCQFDKLEEFLRSLPSELPRRPEAIVVISGHWEEDDFGVMAAAKPKMIYDFGGFPEHTYRITYPAPGSPELAARIHKLIEAAGLKSHLDHARGFDHGTYSMLYPMFPNAHVPVVQVSIRRDFDPDAHLRVGRALAVLRGEGVLILGSGNTFHNFHPPRDANEHSRVFEEWLQESLVSPAGNQREQRLIHWSEAPSARVNQPREDHLIPLLVAAGSSHDESASLAHRYEMLMFGQTLSSSYRFG